MWTSNSSPNHSDSASINDTFSAVNKSNSFSKVKVSFLSSFSTFNLNEGGVFFRISLSTGMSCDSSLCVKSRVLVLVLVSLVLVWSFLVISSHSL